MKKTITTLIIALSVAFSCTMSSCIGSFSLTKEVMKWNNQVGSKFVNEIVFFAFWVIPVYEVSSMCDLLVLNSIEFWSGTNPLSASVKTIDTDHGRYLVKCDGKGYDVINESTGTTVRLDFCDDTWYARFDDTSYPLVTFLDDNTVLAPGADGTMHCVALSEEGVRGYALEFGKSQIWTANL